MGTAISYECVCAFVDNFNPIPTPQLNTARSVLATPNNTLLAARDFCVLNLRIDRDRDIFTPPMMIVMLLLLLLVVGTLPQVPSTTIGRAAATGEVASSILECGQGRFLHTMTECGVFGFGLPSRK